MSTLLRNILAKLKAAIKPILTGILKKTGAVYSKNILPDFRQAIRSRTGIALLALSVFLGLLLLTQFLNPVLVGPLSAFAQGRIGVPTLTLGSFSIHPVTAVITNKGPVCLVLVAVEITDQAFRFSDGEIFLMSGQHTYPTANMYPVGQEALFGQHKIRALAFHPTELCKQGRFQVEDLGLLLVHPTGIGIVSFAAPITVKANK